MYTVKAGCLIIECQTLHDANLVLGEFQRLGLEATLVKP